MAFYEHEPWGFLAKEYRAGLIASTIVNTTPRERGAKMFKRDDWTQDPWGGRVDDFTPEQRAFIEKRKQQKGKKSGKRG